MCSVVGIWNGLLGESTELVAIRPISSSHAVLPFFEYAVGFTQGRGGRK